MLSESASPATALSVPFSSSFSSFSSFVLHVPVVYPSAHLQLPVHSLSARKIYPPAVIRIFFASRWTVHLVIPLTSITNLLLRPGWVYFFHRRLFHQQSSPITLVIVAAAKETKKENVKAAFHPTKKRINEHQLFSTKSFSNRKMRDMSSKFIEILDPNDTRPRMSDCDVRLEDVLADHEALVTRPRSSTQSSSKPSLDNRLDRDSPTSPTQRWKRLSTILVPARRGSA